MRKLIIGCGYLGQRVAAAWLRDGHKVAALTRSPQNAQRFRELGLEPVLGDVTLRDSLAMLPVAETVLYAVGYDRGSGRTQRDVYVDGLENVLKEIASRTRRFVYISSTSVYGQTGGEWVDESSECRPVTPNGQVCLEAEAVVWKHFPQLASRERERPDDPVQQPESLQSLTLPARQEERGAIILRLAGLYGPGRLAARVEALKAGEPPGGNPDAWLNLIHVDDAVQAVLAAEERGQWGSTYLVCDDQPVTRREYYEALTSHLGLELPSNWRAGSVSDRSVEVRDESRPRGSNKRISNRKLRDELDVRLAYPSITAGLPANL